ncbi:uncharacterized protein LOC143283845 [Babylonia areolata]|uniref:uncharacterized protein LOC143283845 n=1 Tax=Babylonia areolata TaxID=304850 RepID=UPI003FD06292
MQPVDMDGRTGINKGTTWLSVKLLAIADAKGSAALRNYGDLCFRNQSLDLGENSGAASRAEAEYETKAVYLSTTNTYRASTNAPSRVGFDLDAEFDYDSKTVSPDTYASHVALLQQRYKKLCQSLKVVPCSALLKQVGQPSVSLQNVALSSLDLKAVVTVLVVSCFRFGLEMDTELAQLDISGNTFRKQEAEYLSQLLKGNRFLTNLVLSDNQLSGEGLDTLVPSICDSKVLRTLDLSGNGLCDRDSASLCRLIENAECITDLILHHNELGQCGVALGSALAENDTITHLNISWNHIRGAGAVGLAKGIGKNSTLSRVNFAWNGFGYEGCVALSHALATNTTLHLLDLTNNRIHPPALLQLFNGICRNKTLSSLSLGLNPIPAHLTTYLLKRISKWKHGNLKELDLTGIVVDKDFDGELRQIQDQRLFIVRYDTSLSRQRRESRVDPSNIYNIDPMRILFFMKEHLRTIDLFLKIDTNNDGLLSREEMKYAFELEGYPVSEKALDQVMTYLDTNKSGEVDLGEFFDAERRMRRTQTREKEEDDARLQRLKREAAENPLGSPSLTQSVNPTYSQAFRKPAQGLRLPKVNK